MRNKWKLLPPILCLLFLLSACSYMEFEDSLKSNFNKLEEEENINPAKIPVESSSTEEIDSPETSTQILYSIGDTVTFTYGDGKTVEYTVNQVSLADNIKYLDLYREDFNDTSLISGNGNIANGYQLLTIDVTVKNINIDQLDEDIDKNIPVLFIEPAIGFRDGIEDPDGPFAFGASYFSKHTPDNGNGENKHYYYFPLEIGKEVDVIIGWFIPTEEVKEEPLYYIIGYPGLFEDYEYFKLDID